MKFNDAETQSIANAVSDVLEGKVKKEGYGKKKIKSGYGEEAKYPHDMFHPETGAKVVANNEKDHEELSKKGYTHEKPVKESPEEPRAKGEKEFKDKHVVKKSGENPDGTVTKEDSKRQLTDEQKYKEFFASALKKYGVESPQELDKEKRKEFFNYVDKNYKATNENVIRKAAQGVKRGIDKVAGTDLAGDKRKKAEKIQKAKDRIKSLELDQKRYFVQIGKKEDEFKAGKIDKVEFDDKEEFYLELDFKAGQKIQDLKDKIRDLQKESVSEATLKVDGFTGKTDDGENKDSVNEPKKKGLRGRIKIMSKGSSQMGGVKAVMTGSEEDLISYAKMHLGADSDAKTLADVQKDIN